MRLPGRDLLETAVEQFKGSDLIILQRCYKLALAQVVKQAASVLGIPFVFETDDDYLNLPPYNPCYRELGSSAAKMEFINILRLADAITVSTSELRSIYYPYNKNIYVVPNNIENIHYAKDEHTFPVKPDGSFDVSEAFNFFTIPKFLNSPAGDKELIRIGYTGTPTHIKDFETIKYHYYKLAKKWSKKGVLFVYIGDAYFAKQHAQEATTNNLIHIPYNMYYLYTMNIRNLDIGICPLLPDPFNMSKSPLKALEYAAWGIAPVVPHYVTYLREFTPNVSCLSYFNGMEFYDHLEDLLEHPEKIKKIGGEARKVVENNRLENNNAPYRNFVYQEIVAEHTKEVKRHLICK